MPIYVTLFVSVYLYFFISSLDNVNTVLKSVKKIFPMIPRVIGSIQHNNVHKNV